MWPGASRHTRAAASCSQLPASNAWPGGCRTTPPPSPHLRVQVSDLDGTMVGDDAATAAFKGWWEDCGAVRGGMLVYNTGR